MSQKVRVRFAPSPTGALHVGGARAALFNWLFAKHIGGVFVLRIEDTDATRSTEASVQGILDGMRWLGLDWDEGPEVGGDYGPYFQSERLHLYRQYAQRLLEMDMAYPCFCTTEALDTRRKAALAAGKPPKYDRQCKQLTPEQRQARIDEGVPYVLRFYSRDEGETVFQDRIRGEVKFANEVLDDFVIIRTDKLPTYNFAVVVDDHEMGITHVVRGEDHISNTPRQIQVYEALGLPLPEFAHLPMILGPDRSKLSKRHGAKDIMEFAADGYLPEAIVNYLALLGWSYDDKTELFEVPDELVEKFTLDRVSKNPAIFDFQKFEWMNGVYMRSTPAATIAEKALPLMQDAGLLPAELSEEAMDRYVAIVAAVQGRLKTINDTPDQTRYFFQHTIAYDENAFDKFLRRDYVPELIEKLLPALNDLVDFTEEAIEPIFDVLGEEMGLRKVDLMQPVRVAVTGNTASPGIHETLALIGKEKSCQRLQDVADMLKEA